MDPIALDGLSTDQLIVAAIIAINGLISEVNSGKIATAAIQSNQSREAALCIFHPARGVQSEEARHDFENMRADILATKAYIRGFWKGLLALGGINVLAIGWQIGPAALRVLGIIPP